MCSVVNGKHVVRDSSEAAPRDGVWSPNRRALTLGLALTITLVGFEALAIATVLPDVNRDLHGISLHGWVFSGFFLGSLLGIVDAGRQSDRRGPAAPFVVGITLFGLGLLAGGLAPSMPVLVAARCVQGIGAGAIPAVGYVAIGRAYPASLQPRMFAMLSTAWVLPGVIGPAIVGRGSCVSSSRSARHREVGRADPRGGRYARRPHVRLLRCATRACPSC
jgi:MFS family permease